MRPDERELDEEIRGHMAISIKERIERGEDPEAARLAALREFGYVPAIRDSMRRVWYSRWFDAAIALGQDMRIGLRSLRRAKGLAATVVVTLALGVGANAAIFSVVRGVLLRPLVNRGEDRLIYIRQSAPGIRIANTTFSMAEIDDFKSRATTIGGVRRLLDDRFHDARLRRAPRRQGRRRQRLVLRRHGPSSRPRAAAERRRRRAEGGGAAVLTHRFWTTSLNKDPGVIGKTIQPWRAHGDGCRRPRTFGALSRRHGNHREHGDESASPWRDDGQRADAPDDRALRAAGARRLGRRCPRRTDGGARRDDAREPRGVFDGG